MKVNLSTVAALMNEIIEAHSLNVTLCSPIVEADLQYFVEAEHNAIKTGDPALYRRTAYMAWLEENEYKMCRS